MGYMKTIKLNFFLLIIGILLTTSVFADETKENRQECYDYISKQYTNLEIYPDDYYLLRNNLDELQYTPMKRTWTNLNFIEPFVFVKLYHFGEKSSFKYDYREYEKSKFGSMLWPNNHEYQYFEQYSVKPNSSDYQFEGCGVINMRPVGDYTLNTITNEDNYFLNVYEWKFDVDEESPYSLSTFSCFETFSIEREYGLSSSTSNFHSYTFKK
jgi:hypothetical protein